MSISASDLRRAISDLWKFNPQDFSVQSSGVGFNVGVASSPRSSGGGGTISFVYCIDSLNPREEIFPGGLSRTVLSTTAVANQYATLAAGLTALASLQTSANTLGGTYAQQDYQQSIWTGLNWGLTNFPAVTSPGIDTGTTRVRSIFGAPGIATPLVGIAPQIYFAYKASCIFTRRTTGTQCGVACVIRGCSLRLYAFMKTSGVPKRYRVAYTIDQYLEISRNSSAGTAPATTSVQSLSAPTSTSAHMDISFSDRLGLYGFDFPAIDIFSLAWPTVPSLPAASAGTYQGMNYQAKLALKIVSITALP